VNIEIANESGITVPDFNESELVELSRFVLDQLHIHPQAELSILLVDTAVMSDLHEKWLGEPGPTDVMSFPMDELTPGHPGAVSAPGHLGDIVLCPEVAIAQASAAGHSTAEELLLLTTHSILHLLGYDHAEPADEAEMFALQRKLLLTYLSSRTS
jgi:probable rRNA maturation factor